MSQLEVASDARKIALQKVRSDLQEVSTYAWANNLATVGGLIDAALIDIEIELTGNIPMRYITPYNRK